MEKKIYDLEERTLVFAKRVLKMVKALPKDNINKYYGNQCLRSASSIGANYREANDALGRKNFVHRVKISRKEAKETAYWIELIMEHNQSMVERIQPLLQEAVELRNILSSIINKTEKNKLELEKQIGI